MKRIKNRLFPSSNFLQGNYVFDTKLTGGLSFFYTGFEYVAVACCGTGLFEMGYLCDNLSPLTCSDADKYLFWDSFHPTEKTNRIVAEEALKTNLAQFLH